MTLHVLHPIDCYTCHECGDLVSYRRGTLPTGWASTLCAACDAMDRARARQALAATVAEGLPPCRERGS